MTSSQGNGDAGRASDEEYADSKDPFIIESKGPVERLKQWRVLILTNSHCLFLAVSSLFEII